MIQNFAQMLAQWLVSVLPNDPIQPFLRDLEIPFLGWVNWFIPVSFLLSILGAWIAVISAYYIWATAARFVNLID